MASVRRYIRLPALRLRGKEIPLQYPLVRYNADGRKILLISDSLSVEEAESGQLFSARVGQTLDAVIEHASQLEGQTPGAVLAVTTRVVRQQSLLNDAERGQNYRRITRRLCNLIAKWQPDCVIFLGYQQFLDIWLPRVTFTERAYKSEQLAMLRGRLLPAKIAGHKCQIILSFSPRAFASLEYKDYKNRVNLIGFVVGDVQAAIRGENRYTVPTVDKSQRKVIRTRKEFDALYAKLLACETPSIDCETDNLNRVYDNRLLVILFSFDGKFTYLLPFQHPQTPFTPQELTYIKDKLRDYFENGKSKYHIYQNAKFDGLQFFAQLGVRYYNHRVYDIMAGEYFLDENRKFFRAENLQGAYTLEFISAQYGALGYEESPIAKTDRGRMAEYSLAQILDYGVFDVVYPYWICQFQIQEARRRGPQYRLFLRTVCELGTDMVLSFIDMERNGTLVDRHYLNGLLAPNSSLSQELAKVHGKLRSRASVRKSNAILLQRNGAPSNSQGLFGRQHNTMWVFDVNKPSHQQVLFFEVLGLQPLEYRKDGGGKTNKAFLREYQESVEEVKLLADYRAHEKLRNTYVDGLAKQLQTNPDAVHDNALRANYGFIYIVTVRTSATAPNLQNMPSRGPLAKIIKRMFVARRGKILVKLDYMAHEVRGWANVSGDVRIARAFAPGMLLRRQIRIMRGRDAELDKLAEDWLLENKWEELKTIEDKQAAIKRTRNQPDLHRLLNLLVELEIKGDVHRMNYQFFFGVPAANVNKVQRQSVKEVVFGVMYEKQAPSLAAGLYEEKIKPIRRKYVFRINRALLRHNAERAEELKQRMNKELRPYWDEAQGLIDKLFTTFKRGGRWIRKLQRQAARDLYAVSPFGAVRHLWGYLHADTSVHKVMDRRGPNSVIQGASSNLGYTGARRMAKFNWQLQQQDIDLGYSHNNFVHDSCEAEAEIALLPLTLYYQEHAMTTQTHRRARETYDFNMLIGLEIDMELGGAMSRTQKWDFNEAGLLRIVGAEIDWMNAELRYGLDKAELLKCVRHNFRLVNKYRLRELQQQGDTYAPSEEILLPPEKAAHLDWRLPATALAKHVGAD